MERFNFLMGVCLAMSATSTNGTVEEASLEGERFESDSDRNKPRQLVHIALTESLDYVEQDPGGTHTGDLLDGEALSYYRRSHIDKKDDEVLVLNDPKLGVKVFKEDGTIEFDHNGLVDGHFPTVEGFLDTLVRKLSGYKNE